MIRRIAKAALLSLRLQVRARFPQVYLLVTILTVLVLSFAVPAAAVAWVLPVFLFTEPGMIGANMVAAFRYMEKGDGTVAALMVTPLRPIEHLVGFAIASALLGTVFGTLTYLAVTQDFSRSLLVAPPLFGFGFLSALVGFLLSMRFADFSRFILGGIPWLLLWQLPLLGYLEVLPWPAVGWVPSTPGLLALADLTTPEPNVAWILAMTGILFALCLPSTLWVARRYEQRIHQRAEFA